MTKAQVEAHQRKHGFLPSDWIHNPDDSALRPVKSPMNKTEAEYALILEAMKRRGEILRYEYEGITLHWAGMKYTPDFVVFRDVNLYPIGTQAVPAQGAKGQPLK